MEQEELPDALPEEMRKLPVAMREAVLCCYLEGMTRQQAAEKLGLTVRTIDLWLDEGKRRLRDQLEARGLPVPLLLSGSSCSLSALLSRWWLLATL